MNNKITIKERELEKVWQWHVRLTASIKQLRRMDTEVGNMVEKLKRELKELRIKEGAK